MDFEKTIIVDIDDTLITSEKRNCVTCGRTEYLNPEPIEDQIKTLNILKSNGYYVILHTGRKEDCRKITEDQLKNFNIDYDELVMNKPSGRWYVDKDSVRDIRELL